MSVTLTYVSRDNQVQALLDEYMSGGMTYSQLSQEFRDRGWSTLSLYEIVRSLDIKGRENEPILGQMAERQRFGKGTGDDSKNTGPRDNS